VVGLICCFQALPQLLHRESESKLDALLTSSGRSSSAEWDLWQRLEWMTYDWRMRFAARHRSSPSENLGFVSLDDRSLALLLNGTLGYRYGLLWPRDVYAQLLRELSSEGAQGVAFDILLTDLRPDHDSLTTHTPPGLTPDGFFAQQLRTAPKTILAASHGSIPPDRFRTNCWSLGDVATDKESDGILRRAKPFREYPLWHPSILARVESCSLDLAHATFQSNQIHLPRLDGQEPLRLSTHANGDLDLEALNRDYLLCHPAILDLVKPMRLDLASAEIGPGTVRVPRRDGNEPFELPLKTNGSLDLAELGRTPERPGPPLQQIRVWHMGIVLAAARLNLDLAAAEIGPREIILRSPGGDERRIPLDPQGYFCIDWTLRPNDPSLTQEAIEHLLARDLARQRQTYRGETNPWKGKLVVVGSMATGGNLTDLGATPLDENTYLMSKHWNIAQSVLTGRFIRPARPTSACALAIVMGALAGILTWRLPVWQATSSVLALSGVYVAAATAAFVLGRLWIPIVLPLAGAFWLTHVALVTYRVVFEEKERRRVRSVFSKIVAPEVVNELLSADEISLGKGARRELTVLFADVRGFTEFTEKSQMDAEAYVQRRGLSPADAERHFDRQSQEALETVNAYLSVIADTVKKHGGTLDKYIGDCVMAFWGAPTTNPRHAAASVEAAIEAHQQIDALNARRTASNHDREQANAQRSPDDPARLPLHPILKFGTGINTGKVTVGLMGSDAHILNYTVFGREVNLASRLESASGFGRILISAATFHALESTAPPLARRCVEVPRVTMKGIREPVRVYEVVWRETNASASSPETQRTSE
jgi:class 3 adenylate cyclase/CHASE2 domain-containing sensor protein